MSCIKYKSKEDKIGEISNNKQDTPMKLIAYRNMRDCDIEFQDEYKYVFKHANYNNFLKGQIKNPYDKTVCGVGMIGDGKYGTEFDDGTDSKIYNSWKWIRARCYVYKDKCPSYYALSTIQEEWKNFQVFAKWYEDNWYPLPTTERFHIDKDILYPGNKHYSEKTCILVPQRINMLFTNKTNKRGLPNGIFFSKNKYLAKYNLEILGKFNSLEEAFNAYANKKEENIKLVADEYKKYIPLKLYNALYNYKVKIENDKNYKI